MDIIIIEIIFSKYFIHVEIFVEFLLGSVLHEIFKIILSKNLKSE